MIDENCINEIIKYIEESLKDLGMDSRNLTKALLTAEEAAGSLIAHSETEDPAKEGSSLIKVVVRRILGEITIEMSAKGRDYPLAENMESVSVDSIEDADFDFVQSFILQKCVTRRSAESGRRPICFN